MLRRFAFLLATMTLGCSLTPAAVAPGAPRQVPFAALAFDRPSLDALLALSRRMPALVAAGADPAAPLAPGLPYAQSGNVESAASFSLDALAGRPEETLSRNGLTERRMLTMIDEATTDGFTGDYASMRRQRVDPLLAGWASDAVLVRANVTPEELAGGTAPPSPPCSFQFFGPPWDMVFVSAAKSEALRVTVDGIRTRVVRWHWEPLSPPPPPFVPAVGREEAIARLVAALRSPEKPGAEENSRLDYFQGTPWAEPSYYPGEVAVEGPPGPLYDVPDGTRWVSEFQHVLGHNVWLLRAESAVAPSPAPSAGYRLLCTSPPTVPHLTTRSLAWGMVDADTGTVIRFVRPAHVTTRVAAQ